YVVLTGRVVVPAGNVIIVSSGRLSLISTGRVLSPGSDNESDDASVHSEATNAQQQPNIQLQKDEDIWNAVKARFGGNAESKKMRKSMLKQKFLEFIIGEAEGLHKG
nr:ribonuclease H-like domain-containing protein [Tanacetum cinerariifolium]